MVKNNLTIIFFKLFIINNKGKYNRYGNSNKDIYFQIKYIN